MHPDAGGDGTEGTGYEGTAERGPDGGTDYSERFCRRSEKARNLANWLWTSDFVVEDLRTCTVDGEPVLVFRKRRPLERRFANENVSVDWVRPQEVFTPAEIDLIRRFTSEIRLDWGGVDVLRNKKDGRIFIVDANKTDMGPPVALPLGQKLRATRLLARAFATAFAP